VKTFAAAAATTYTFGRPVKTVAVVAFVLGVLYALSLAYLERQYPINPDYTALEVVGGVVISLLPVFFTARYEARLAGLSWRTYERMVCVGFIGSGLPILIWQAIEFVVRHG
jgi:hypothetical protein